MNNKSLNFSVVSDVIYDGNVNISNYVGLQGAENTIFLSYGYKFNKK